VEIVAILFTMLQEFFLLGAISKPQNVLPDVHSLDIYDPAGAARVLANMTYFA